ncbi:hypothetical protein E8E13_002014 [Curvularia kusanoi]|uniref:Uncharacterized protein n=1 Tax=Curvularia kusanoi TaxID=90978 RepID=A0A9P4W4V1_CURKU|nr:hypothetical protein E8E13_002014 [Curvularia kusanoi]
MEEDFAFDPPGFVPIHDADSSDDANGLWTWPGDWLQPQAPMSSVKDDDESHDSDSTLNFEDNDGRLGKRYALTDDIDLNATLAGITQWTHRAASWRDISNELRERSEETVTVDVPIQQLAQSPTEKLLPTCSDIDLELQSIFHPSDIDLLLQSVFQATPLYEQFGNIIETLQSFSVCAQLAWCEGEEGPQHRQIVIELFTSLLVWTCIAHAKPDSIPREFALPSPAIVTLMAGAMPSQCTTNELQYPYDLTVWDAQGLLSDVAFEAWEEANSVSLAALREFWRNQVPTLLDESYESLTKFFEELDEVLRDLSHYGE